MAFDKSLRPDQLAPGQMRPKGVNERMNQGSNNEPHERDLFKGMKQRSMATDRPSPTEMKTPNSRMKQGGR